MKITSNQQRINTNTQIGVVFVVTLTSNLGSNEEAW
jgi:hypothetical protein